MLKYHQTFRLILSQVLNPRTVQSSTPPSLLHAHMSLRLVPPKLAPAKMYGSPKTRVNKSFTLAVDSATTSVRPTIRRQRLKGIYKLILSRTRRISTTLPEYVSPVYVYSRAQLTILIVPRISRSFCQWSELCCCY